MAGSDALAFGELLAGGILLTMGVSGRNVREVLAGKAGSIEPVKVPDAGLGHATGPIGAGREGVSYTVKGTTPAANRFIRWAESQQGVKEGSAQQAAYAKAAGVSAAAAWCASFIAYGLKRLGIRPPQSPAAVSSWAGWSGGTNVGTDLSRARPGDLLRFGSEHIALYLGGGRMISGNWSNEVGVAQVGDESTPLSEIIRVNGLYGAGARNTLRGAARALNLSGVH